MTFRNFRSLLLLLSLLLVYSESDENPDLTEQHVESATTISAGSSAGEAIIQQDNVQQENPYDDHNDLADENEEQKQSVETTLSTSTSVADERNEPTMRTLRHTPIMPGYGTEVSWPMQRTLGLSDDLDEFSLLPEHQYESYNQYMRGCYDKYNKEKCDYYEQERIATNSMQPSNQLNFTSNGYMKAFLPTLINQALQKFWKASLGYNSNDHNSVLGKIDELRTERWDSGSNIIYTNHWDAGTKVLPIDGSDYNSARLTSKDRKMIIQHIHQVSEQWTGVPLMPTSMHGIRINQNGSIVPPHVDRYVH